jgi:CDP-diacylglycerol--glycerol-3-phosphate 3-phosphatidyltransferase
MAVVSEARGGVLLVPQPSAAPSNVNVPNVLTGARLLAVPVFAVLLLTGMDSTAGQLWAWGIFTAACLTDVIDGHLARRRNQVTAFGIMADPIADKALVGSALVGLSALGLLPWWATVVILLREIAVTVMRSVLLRHGLLPASRGGKAKCLAQNTAVALHLLPLAGAWASLRGPVLWLAVLLTLTSAISYVVAGARLRRRAQSARDGRLPC